MSMIMLLMHLIRAADARITSLSQGDTHVTTTTTDACTSRQQNHAKQLSEGLERGSEL